MTESGGLLKGEVRIVKQTWFALYLGVLILAGCGVGFRGCNLFLF